MNRRIVGLHTGMVICFAAALLLIPGTQRDLGAQAALKAGDIVWAEWQPNAWYHGKIERKCDLGWHVLFDDGDQKCCHPDKVVKDVAPPKGLVKKASRVLAQWTDGRYYPGIVASIVE